MSASILRKEKTMINEILNVKVEKMMKTEGDGKIKAYCDLMFGDLFLIKGFKIIEGDHGLFVAMPQRENKQGKRYAVFVPMTKEIKEYIQEVILDEYQGE